MYVQPSQHVLSAWIDIDLVVLGNRARMAAGDIEGAMRKVLQMGECGSWPPPNGVWREDGRFIIYDGRHEYMARLALGFDKIFVCWLAEKDV